VESAIRPSQRRDFRLIETFAWRRNPGFLNLDLHLARMERGARLFDFSFDRERIDETLEEVGRGPVPLRVRLTLGRDDLIDAEAQPFQQGPPIWNTTIARERLDPADPWLRVKTTQRALYDRTRAALPSEIHEMIFLNQRGEVCEGTIFNIFLKVGDQLLTPRLSCGLLPGVLRESLLRSGRAREAVLSVEDLSRGTLMLGNSLRGLCPARLVRPVASLARM
jgi:4-amino-4-deoxychorismate lyase